MSPAQRKIKRWREDPVIFVQECLGADPDPWQVDILRAFPQNRRLAMKAAKGCGKSTILSWLAWAFLATRAHPKIAATSISADNLSDGLWTEMAKWHAKSEFLKRAFTWTKTRIFATDHSSTWWMSARTWPKGADTTQQANTLAGLHAEHLLFILDEVGGIPDAVMAAAEAGLSSGGDTKMIMAGNPTHLEGPLYRACTSERHLWYLAEITGDPDNPKRAARIDLEWAKTQIEKYGADSPWVLVNVFGQFPPSSLNSLLGPNEVSLAMGRHIKEDAFEFSQKRLGIDVARFGDDRCFDDQTEILTSEGWRFFKDLHGLEKVLTIGANEQKASWGKILHVQRYEFDGYLNLYEKKHINFAITDNHRMFVKTNPRSEKYCFKSYRDLAEQFVVRANNGWAGRNQKYKVFTMNKKMFHGGSHKRKKKFLFVDWAAFLGWFVSEGNVYVSLRRDNEFRIIISQYPGLKRQKLEALLTAMGISWRSCSNGTQLEFSSRPIGHYLIKQCGVGANHKRVPSEIKNASEAVLEAFLDAFLLGDGTKRSDGMGRTYITSSFQLANDIQEMLAKLGRAGSIKLKCAKGSKFNIGAREVLRQCDVYYVYERSAFKYKYVNKNEVKAHRYKGIVWCVATPKESIYVRRHGVPMWSGNSCIFPRQGLATFKPIEMRGANTIEVAARVMASKARWESEMEFVDGTGGFGGGVIDQLIQAGLTPQEVHFSGKATDPRYFNKRAEMWFEMASWIKRGGALPNIPTLARELTTPTYTIKNGKFLLESKDQIKERLGFSPDLADSLALTFSLAEMPRSMALPGQSYKMKFDYDPFA